MSAGAVDLTDDHLGDLGGHLRDGDGRGQGLRAAAGGEVLQPVQLGAGVLGVLRRHAVHRRPEDQVVAARRR